MKAYIAALAGEALICAGMVYLYSITLDPGALFAATFAALMFVICLALIYDSESRPRGGAK